LMDVNTSVIKMEGISALRVRKRRGEKPSRGYMHEMVYRIQDGRKV